MALDVPRRSFRILVVDLTMICFLCSGTVTVAADKNTAKSGGSREKPRLTHGPLLGDMTDSSVRVWARADRPCRLQVRAVNPANRKPIASETVRLVKSDNYCGSVRIANLKPLTKYTYSIFLDGDERDTSLLQEFRTFPPPDTPGVLRIGFGHSLPRVEGEQTTWRAVASKKPDLFLIMGDNIYSNTTDPVKQRRMYLDFRADPHFRAFGASTPVFAIWDDHDYGKNNSDRTQEGKERSLKTFFEIWPNPPAMAEASAPGIWTQFRAGGAEFWLLDVRYHRSPDDDPDGPSKTMLGEEQRQWFLKTLSESTATFKFPVSGSSWNCGGVEAWNHRYLHEYNVILDSVREHGISGLILLGGDQHQCKVAVRPRESWGGYDLHEWMAGQLWNDEKRSAEPGVSRGFGIITVDTRADPPSATLEFFDHLGRAKEGTRVPYTDPGALRALWSSPEGATEKPPRSADGELRPLTSGAIWDALPVTTGYALPLPSLRTGE